LRWLFVVAVLAVVGCHTTDPCFGHDGTCIGLVVDGSGTISQIDQLSIDLSSVGLGTMQTPSVPSLSSLPVTTALYLPANVAGEVTITVSGLLGGSVVGTASATRTITPGDHVSVEVQLSTATSDDGGIPDAASNVDAAGNVDFSTSDDAGAIDAGPPGPDMARRKRYVFLVGPQMGALGSIDATCASAASGHGLPGSGYKGLVGVANGPDQTFKNPSPDRDVVLPNGALVSSDTAFFTAAHVGPIDLLADKSMAQTSCVWTNLTATGSARATDCAGWTSGLILNHGNTGNAQAITMNWANESSTTCDMPCYVYCIEDD
jgi:hypothetical protein